MASRDAQSELDSPESHKNICEMVARAAEPLKELRKISNSVEKAGNGQPRIGSIISRLSSLMASSYSQSSPLFLTASQRSA